MTQDEAIALIGEAVGPGEAWVELGAGMGTFTRALATRVGRAGTVWAVDRREDAVRVLGTLDAPDAAPVRAVRADFTEPLDLPSLDGILMANALHFVPDPKPLLRTLVAHLRPGGRFLVVEYDLSRGSPWVPYPVPPSRFRKLTSEVGLDDVREIGRRRSSFGREMYAAVGSRARPGSS